MIDKLIAEQEENYNVASQESEYLKLYPCPISPFISDDNHRGLIKHKDTFYQNESFSKTIQEFFNQ